MNDDQSGDGDQRVPASDPPTVSAIESLDVDELFTVLSRPGNRYVLTYLLQQDGPVSLVELVEYVVDVTEPPAGMRRAEFSGELLNRFLETVLPALDDTGLVAYDRKRQMINETETTSLTLPYLRDGLEQAEGRSERRT